MFSAIYPSHGGIDTVDVAATTVVESSLFLSGSSPIAGKVVQFSFDGGHLTSDAGVVVLADIERRFGIAERLARCFEDPRSPGRVHHTVADMIRFRVLLIAAGCPNANDCDALRTDPAFKPGCGGKPGIVWAPEPYRRPTRFTGPPRLVRAVPVPAWPGPGPGATPTPGAPTPGATPTPGAPTPGATPTPGAPAAGRATQPTGTPGLVQ